MTILAEDVREKRMLLTHFPWPEVLFLGAKGSGKTAFATYFSLLIAEIFDLKLYANFPVYSDRYVPLTSMAQLDDITDAVLLVDELQTLADSRNFKNANNSVLAKQLANARKNGVFYYGITQFHHNIDLRLREQFSLIFQMEKVQKFPFENSIFKLHIFKPQGLTEWNEIVENSYVKTEKMSYKELSNFFSLYDTLGAIHLIS